MPGIEGKNLDQPDEVRNFDHGEVDLMRMENGSVGKIVLQPGWRWSHDVKPIANPQSCQAPHFQFVLSGRLHARMDDGTDIDMGPGDVIRIDSGHDAWVVGDEPFVAVDWGGLAHYAEKR